MKLFLFIFRTVARFNAPAGIGGDRTSTNYFNGILLVSLLQIVLLNDAYIILTWILPIAYPRSYIIPVIIFIVLVLANYGWLIIHGAGTKYIRNFRGEPATQRILRISAIAIIAIAVIGFFLLTPDRAPV